MERVTGVALASISSPDGALIGTGADELNPDVKGGGSGQGAAAAAAAAAAATGGVGFGTYFGGDDDDADDADDKAKVRTELGESYVAREVENRPARGEERRAQCA